MEKAFEHPWDHDPNRTYVRLSRSARSSLNPPDHPPPHLRVTAVLTAGIYETGSRDYSDGYGAGPVDARKLGAWVDRASDRSRRRSARVVLQQVQIGEASARRAQAAGAPARR